MPLSPLTPDNGKSKLNFKQSAVVLTSRTAFENVIVEKKGEKNNVALITLNRPKALNALNSALMTDLSNALDELENDNDVAAIVITGSTKAFAGLDPDDDHDCDFNPLISNLLLQPVLT